MVSTRKKQELNSSEDLNYTFRKKGRKSLTLKKTSQPPKRKSTRLATKERKENLINMSNSQTNSEIIETNHRSDLTNDAFLSFPVNDLTQDSFMDTDAISSVNIIKGTSVTKPSITVNSIMEASESFSDVTLESDRSKVKQNDIVEPNQPVNNLSSYDSVIDTQTTVTCEPTNSVTSKGYEIITKSTEKVHRDTEISNMQSDADNENSTAAESIMKVEPHSPAESVHSDDTVIYDPTTSISRPFSPQPSTSKDDVIIQQNEKRFNESFGKKFYCKVQVEISEKVCNDKHGSTEPIIIIDDDDDLEKVQANHDVTPTINEKPNIVIRENSPDIIIQDEYNTNIEIETIDIDNLIAENNSLIEKYKKSENLNSVTEVQLHGNNKNNNKPKNNCTNPNSIAPQMQEVVNENPDHINSKVKHEKIEKIVENFFNNYTDLQNTRTNIEISPNIKLGDCFDLTVINDFAMNTSQQTTSHSSQTFEVNITPVFHDITNSSQQPTLQPPQSSENNLLNSSIQFLNSNALETSNRINNRPIKKNRRRTGTRRGLQMRSTNNTINNALSNLVPNISEQNTPTNQSMRLGDCFDLTVINDANTSQQPTTSHSSQTFEVNIMPVFQDVTNTSQQPTLQPPQSSENNLLNNSLQFLNSDVLEISSNINHRQIIANPRRTRARRNLRINTANSTTNNASLNSLPDIPHQDAPTNQSLQVVSTPNSVNTRTPHNHQKKVTNTPNIPNNTQQNSPTNQKRKEVPCQNSVNTPSASQFNQNLDSTTPPRKTLSDCPICFENLGNCNEIASTNCGHIFCLPCIKRSLASRLSCPACRKRLTKKGYHQIFL